MSKWTSSDSQLPNQKYDENELNDALAAIIASTKRKKRRLNPLEVAEKIERAWDSLDSLSEVAERTDMSTEMLRQIHSVINCSEKVKELVRERKIESYDILHRISKLPSRSQVTVAKAVIAGDLTSQDVRAVVSFYRDFPRRSIRSVIERIKSSRDIKQYVVYFELDPQNSNLEILRSRFEGMLGKGNVVSLRCDDEIGKLVLSVKGKNRLQEEARRQRMIKRELIRKVITQG